MSKLPTIVVVFAATFLSSRLAVCVPEYQRRLVQIEVYRQDGWSCAGVGIILGPQTLLTALHVLKSGPDLVPKIRTRDSNGQTRELSLSAGDARVYPEEHASSGSLTAADVAVVWSQTPVFPFQAIDLTGWITDAEVLDIPEVAIVSAHADCLGDADSHANPVTWLSTSVSPPRATSNDGVTTRRMVLSAAESSGYSGSPVVSPTFGRVIAVYTGSEGGHGAATSLVDVLGLFSTVPDATAHPRRLTRRLRPFLLGAYAAVVTGLDPLTSMDYPPFGVSMEYLFTLVPEHEWYWHGFGSFRVSVGSLLELSSWHRQQVIFQYPGSQTYTADRIRDISFSTVPRAGMRLELWRLAFGFDPIAIRVRTVNGPDPTQVSWEPAGTIGFRVPGPIGERLWLVTGAAKTIWSNARVSDYHFDLAGSPGMYDRKYSAGEWNLRLAVQVAL